MTSAAGIERARLAEGQGLGHHVHPEVGPHDGHEVVARGAGAGAVAPPQHHLAAFEHGRHRVGDGEHQRCLRPQHAVGLAEDAGQVVDDIERGGEDEVDRAAGGEAEVGDVAPVELDPYPGLLGLLTEVDQVVGGYGGHRPRAALGEGDGVGGTTQLDHPLAGDVAAEPQLALVGDARSVGDGAHHLAMMTPLPAPCGGWRRAPRRRAQYRPRDGQDSVPRRQDLRRHGPAPRRGRGRRGRPHRRRGDRSRRRRAPSIAPATPCSPVCSTATSTSP